MKFLQFLCGELAGVSETLDDVLVLVASGDEDALDWLKACHDQFEESEYED